MFQCDAGAGTWSLKAWGIQVISSDHVTPWDTATGPVPGKYWIRVDINHADAVGLVALNQDSSGFFAGSGSGTLGLNAAADCKPGVPVEVQGGSYLDNLNSLDQLGSEY
jgi:hypothetical protein